LLSLLIVRPLPAIIASPLAPFQRFEALAVAVAAALLFFSSSSQSPFYKGQAATSSLIKRRSLPSSTQFLGRYFLLGGNP